MQKVAVIGLGYVGLPLFLAIEKAKKYEVVGFDIDTSKIEKLKKGEDPLDDDFVKRLMSNLGDLTVSAEENVLQEADFFVICVPTPVESNKLPNLGPVKSASQLVARHLKKGATVIVESTVNPGVCEEVVLPILEETGLKAAEDFELSHCPERINPGDEKWTVLNIPRNIGSLTEEGNKKAADFYRSFLEAEVNEVSCLSVAEATKVIENTFRDINIAYVNELSKSFDLMGIDLIEVIKAASNKPFAFMAHFPGCGVGGHCIPVDPYYLIERARKVGFDHSFLKRAREVNNSMPRYAVDKFADALNDFERSIKGTKVAMLGLSYKANVGDLRESPALEVLELLKKKGADVKVFDPYVLNESDVASLQEALEFAEVIFVATGHNEFREISPDSLIEHQIFLAFDGKNCLNKEAIQSSGIAYKGVGR